MKLQRKQSFITSFYLLCKVFFSVYLFFLLKIYFHERNLEFFFQKLGVFSGNFPVFGRTEYTNLPSKSLYSVRIQNIKTRKHSKFGHLSRTGDIFRKLHYLDEVRTSRVTKSSYETELRKMTSHFELLTRKFLQKLLFRVTNLTS